MTVPEFLTMGYSSWAEIHWTKAVTLEQAKMVKNSLGISGEIYRMCFRSNKNSDGFFGWWIGITKDTGCKKNDQTQETNQMPKDG